jgi:hypothetical protein
VSVSAPPAAPETPEATAPLAEPIFESVGPPASVAPDSDFDSDFFEIPTDAGEPSEELGDEHYAELPGFEHDLSKRAVSPFWWLLPVFFALPGGVIAFFLVRKRDARRAKALLITGIVLTVLAAALTAAIALMFRPMPPAPPSTQRPSKTAAATEPTSAPPAVATDYPKWNIIHDRGVKLTRSPESEDPDGKFREDHAYLIENPEGKVRLLVWYARSGSDIRTLRAKPWTNLDTLFKGTDGSAANSSALVTTFVEQHPDQVMLGAYKWTNKTFEPTYWVGWAAEDSAAGTTATPAHGERAYARSGSSWHEVTTSVSTGDAWESTGPVE